MADEDSAPDNTTKFRRDVREAEQQLLSTGKVIKALGAAVIAIAGVGAGFSAWNASLARAADVRRDEGKAAARADVQDRRIDVIEEHMRTSDKRLETIEADVRWTRDGMLELLDYHRARPNRERGK